MNDSPIVCLADASAAVPVTTVADGSARRLQVDARIARAGGVNMVNRYLLSSAASPNMMVTGSGASPVNFSYAPPAGQTVIITQINFVLVAGTIAFNGVKFLNGSALPNGITFNATVGGSTSTLATLKQNEDFLCLASGSNYGAGLAGGLLGGGTNSILTYGLSFSQQLSGSSGDSVFASVRDGITSAATGGNLVYMQASVQGFAPG